jgi:hypothetical protein
MHTFLHKTFGGDIGYSYEIWSVNWKAPPAQNPESGLTSTSKFIISFGLGKVIFKVLIPGGKASPNSC